ncbi:MAG: hypothetical protein NTX50_26675 [Candidatus Sumerlaeota bacterium]|nr:hypothetical protein [Candidatus Sumerlaeota bacterium]
MKSCAFFLMLWLAGNAAYAEPAAGVASRTSAAARQASMSDQLREMNYLIMHLSAINLINGLNLSREQLVQLRSMAQQIEQSGASVPRIQGEFCDDLKLTRDTYNELAGKLLHGETIETSFQMQVAKARTAESSCIRETLMQKPGAESSQGCARCHAAPTEEKADGAAPAPRRSALAKALNPASASASPAAGLEAYQTPQMKMQTFLAHSVGSFGPKGMMMVRQSAPKASGVLTESQRAMVGDFSCCLIPPKNLTDPVRVGQAAVDENTLNMLRGARKTPDAQWPQAKQKIVSLTERGGLMRKPGLSDTDKAAAARAVAETLDRARKMTDVEFEMEKENLAKAMKVYDAKPPSSYKGHEFMTATFLLYPGNVAIYDQAIQKMDKK